MLVKELIKQLERCDPNAKVLIENTNIFLEGTYEALCVKKDINEIYIEPNYTQLIYKE